MVTKLQEARITVEEYRRVDVAYCSALDHYIDEPCIPGEYPPDLVIEMSDPTNKREIARLEQKRAKYLAMGATVWEAWAQAGAVHVYRPGPATPIIEREKLTFDGPPGLEISLAVVFAKLRTIDHEA